MLHLFLDVIAFVSMEYCVDTALIQTRKALDIFMAKRTPEPKYMVVTYRSWTRTYIKR